MIDMEACIDEHLEIIGNLRGMAPEIRAAADRMAGCLEEGGKILWMGNGGSAADSQHLAAELVGRFSRDRQALASIALTTDTSALTALGNDYGYDRIFARQIEALARPGDIVVGISTSGNSANIVQGLETARKQQATRLLLSGDTGGAARAECEHCLLVPSNNVARIQEAHILIGHLLCDWIEARLSR